jgi:hypothetical protein
VETKVNYMPATGTLYIITTIQVSELALIREDLIAMSSPTLEDNTRPWETTTPTEPKEDRPPGGTEPLEEEDKETVVEEEETEVEEN